MIFTFDDIVLPFPKDWSTLDQKLSIDLARMIMESSRRIIILKL